VQNAEIFFLFLSSKSRDLGASWVQFFSAVD